MHIRLSINEKISLLCLKIVDNPLELLVFIINQLTADMNRVSFV